MYEKTRLNILAIKQNNKYEFLNVANYGKTVPFR